MRFQRGEPIGRDAAKATLLAGMLFLLNVWIAWPLFLSGYDSHTESVEGSYISLARYLPLHWGVLNGWWPLWYCGMPFQNVYQPLVHVASAVVVEMGVSPPAAYHSVIAIAYALGPLAAFFLFRRLSGSTDGALGVATLYSLWSPSALLFPAIRNDLGGLWLARRLQTAIVYGDGPHVASLTLVPLALLAMYRLLQSPTLLRLSVASAMTALVVLTNLPGGIVLAFGFLALAVAYSVPVTGWSNLSLMTLTLVFAYALCAHWLPPSTIRTVFANAEAGESQPSHFVLLAASTAIGYALAWVGARRFAFPKYLSFFACWAWPLGLILVADAWFHRELLAQPARFHLGFELAVIPLLASALLAAARPLTRYRPGLLAAALILVTAQAWRYHHFAASLIQPIDISQTSEYRMSKAIQRFAPGERVMVPGSVSFWLNAFVDNPQVNGCCTQGNISPVASTAQFEFFTDALAGKDAGEISKLWLTAVGATVVGVSGPGSTEKYRAVQHPAKFDRILPRLWQDGGDSLYRLPVRYPRIVHAIPESSLVGRAPVNGIDIEPLRAYDLALRDESPGIEDVVWRDSRTLTFTAAGVESRAISVQIPYHPGWQATIDNTTVPVTADELGFMVLRSPANGLAHVTLAFIGSLQMRVLDIINGIALLLLAGFVTSAGVRNGAGRLL